MKHLLAGMLCCACCLTLSAQGNYSAVYSIEDLGPILSNFDSSAVIWISAGKKAAFQVDSIPDDTLDVWKIQSPDFNEPVYAVYADMSRWEGTKEKNYFQLKEKTGDVKAFFFYFKDGTPLEKSDVNLLKREEDIPGY